MIHCIAVDDEPLSLSVLTDNIGKVPYLHLVDTCDSAFQAAETIHEHRVDLLFIDIQMPGMSGLQFIESMEGMPMAIVVTAYKQYALQGFNLDVVDYLIKPVSTKRFMKACNKAQELFGLRKKQEHDRTADYIFVNEGYSLRKITLSDIVWIESSGNYIDIHLESEPKPVLIRMSLKAIEEQLPTGDFLRIHRSTIVAKKSISAVRKNSIFIGDTKHTIGETYKHLVDEFIKSAG